MFCIFTVKHSSQWPHVASAAKELNFKFHVILAKLNRLLWLVTTILDSAGPETKRPDQDPMQEREGVGCWVFSCR